MPNSVTDEQVHHGRREVSVPHGERPLAEQIRFRLFQAKLWREYAMMHDGWAPSHWPGGHRLRTGGWPTPQAWITSMMPKSKTSDVMVLTESVLVGVALACVRLGGDERVLDVIFERARERLAEIRLKDIQTEGHA